MTQRKPISVDALVATRLLRLDAVIQGIVTGVMAGFVVFLATNWLLLEGGQRGARGELILGPHLSLLSHFFIGYTVSFPGSFIGFVYAAGLGFIIGYCVARMYNGFVNLRERKSVARVNRFAGVSGS